MSAPASPRPARVLLPGPLEAPEAAGPAWSVRAVLRRSWIFALSATLAGIAIDAELVATSHGPPAALPPWISIVAYYVAPVAAVLLVGASLVAVPALFLSARERARNSLLAWALDGRVPVVASALLLWASIGYAAPEVRLYRLGRATAALAPDIQSYAAARANGDPMATPPTLGVRGCYPLLVEVDDDGTWALRTHCPRAFAEWDALVYHHGAALRPDDARARQLGAWEYRFD